MSLNHLQDHNREIRGWLLRVSKHAEALPKHLLVRRPCPVCGSRETLLFANNRHLDYERCTGCSLVFMNPAIPADAVDCGFAGDDELLMDYFRIIMKYRSAPPQKPDPGSDGKLCDIYGIKASGRLLDVGCSVGEFLHRAKFFYEVEGVEINPHTAAVAAEHFKVHTRMLSKLGLVQNYDIVTLHQILYGVPDPVALLRDIHRVLRDDGILYINTPNADSYAVKLFGGQVNHLYGYTTQNVFNRASIQKLAELSGFRIRTFRTEWIDIYLADIVELLDHPEHFIHKRNCQVEGYEDAIRQEDGLHRSLKPDLGERGNYLVAVLEKSRA